MIKVNYNLQTGQILGFYPDDIQYTSIPEPYIEITPDQHIDCINNQGLRRVNLQTKQIEAYTPPPPTPDQLWAALRARRNALLAACDWTQLPDSPLAADKKTAWATYRQALRDLPEKTTDPANPVWPTPPQ